MIQTKAFEAYKNVQNLFLKQFLGKNVISKIIWTPAMVDDIFETINLSNEVNVEHSNVKNTKCNNILLLGAGEVGKDLNSLNKGKSSIFTQIQLEFEKVDHSNKYIEIIHSNIVQNVVISLKRIFQVLMINNDWIYKYDNVVQSQIELIFKLSKDPLHYYHPTGSEILDVLNLLKLMMKDDEFNLIVENHHMYGISDSILYQFPNFESIVNRQGKLTKGDTLQ
jgi:hypothetical protein